MRLYQILLLLLLIFVIAPNVLSAPDPLEVKERKWNAQLHIDGEIMEDILFEEIEEEKTQYRTMRVEIKQLYQNTLPLSFKKGQVIDVRYHYIPSWSDYSGGGSIQVMKGDQVKLWLNKKENHLTPILGSYGVELVKENGPRIELTQEPFLHMMKRVWRVSWLNYSSVIVFLLLFITLFIILKASHRYMR